MREEMNGAPRIEPSLIDPGSIISPSHGVNVSKFIEKLLALVTTVDKAAMEIKTTDEHIDGLQATLDTAVEQRDALKVVQGILKVALNYKPDLVLTGQVYQARADYAEAQVALEAANAVTAKARAEARAKALVEADGDSEIEEILLEDIEESKLPGVDAAAEAQTLATAATQAQMDVTVLLQNARNKVNAAITGLGGDSDEREAQIRKLTGQIELVGGQLRRNNQLLSELKGLHKQFTDKQARKRKLKLDQRFAKEVRGLGGGHTPSQRGRTWSSGSNGTNGPELSAWETGESRPKLSRKAQRRAKWERENPDAAFVEKTLKGRKSA